MKEARPTPFFGPLAVAVIRGISLYIYYYFLNTGSARPEQSGAAVRPNL